MWGNWNKSAIARWHRCKLLRNVYLHQSYPTGKWNGKPTYAIRLHTTDIITIKPDGWTVLSTGGWSSQVTCARLNTFGFNVSRAYNNMYITFPELGTFLFKDGMEVVRWFGLPFYDGMMMAPVDVKEEHRAYRRELYQRNKQYKQELEKLGARFAEIRLKEEAPQEKR